MNPQFRKKNKDEKPESLAAAMGQKKNKPGMAKSLKEHMQGTGKGKAQKIGDSKMTPMPKGSSVNVGKGKPAEGKKKKKK